MGVRRDISPGHACRAGGDDMVQARDNRRCEKTFARPDGSVPARCLGLNVERGGSEPGPNGVLIEVTEAELDRLAIREVRYDRVDVTDQVAMDGSSHLDRVFTFRAKPENFAEAPPPGSVILAPYVRAVEAGFRTLGRGELDLFRATTGPFPVEVVEAVLVRDRLIPAGNPRDW